VEAKGGIASNGGGFRGVQQVRKLKKPVDDMSGSLHNLVSLLLMRQTRKRRREVSSMRGSMSLDRDTIFNN
jgi:hypothetical protein